MKKIGSRTGREDSTTIYHVLKKVWGRKVERITSVVPEIQSRPLVTDWLMQSEEEAAAAAAAAAAEAVTDCLWNETNFFLLPLIQRFFSEKNVFWWVVLFQVGVESNKPGRRRWRRLRWRRWRRWRRRRWRRQWWRRRSWRWLIQRWQSRRF